MTTVAVISQYCMTQEISQYQIQRVGIRSPSRKVWTLRKCWQDSCMCKLKFAQLPRAALELYQLSQWKGGSLCVFPHCNHFIWNSYLLFYFWLVKCWRLSSMILGRRIAVRQPEISISDFNRLVFLEPLIEINWSPQILLGWLEPQWKLNGDS